MILFETFSAIVTLRVFLNLPFETSTIPTKLLAFEVPSKLIKYCSDFKVQRLEYFRCFFILFDLTNECLNKYILMILK